MDYKKIRQDILNKIQEESLEDLTLEQIIKKYDNISYKELDLSQIHVPGITGGISGLIFYYPEDAKYSIGISNTVNENRRRFTLAHELGHYFFDQDYLKQSGGDGVILDSEKWLYRPGDRYEDMDDDKKLREIRANMFAAEILMPEEQVKKFYNITTNLSVLAETFKVSEQAMDI